MEAVKRSDVAFGHVDRSQGVRKNVPGLQPTNLALRVAPHFPGKYFQPPPELASLFRKIRVRDYYGTDSEFPIGSANPDLLQDGAFVYAKLENDRGTRHYYTELSVFGQYFFRQTLITSHAGHALVRASEIFCRVDEFCASARKFYAEIGYQGHVLLRASIYGAHALPLGQWEPDSSGMALSHCPDESIGYEVSFLVADWEVETRRAATAALRTIAWAYNWDVTDELIDLYYSKERRR